MIYTLNIKHWAGAKLTKIDTVIVTYEHIANFNIGVSLDPDKTSLVLSANQGSVLVSKLDVNKIPVNKLIKTLQITTELIHEFGRSKFIESKILELIDKDY